MIFQLQVQIQTESGTIVKASGGGGVRGTGHSQRGIAPTTLKPRGRVAIGAEKLRCSQPPSDASGQVGAVHS